jgi:hypothetical protein
MLSQSNDGEDVMIRRIILSTFLLLFHVSLVWAELPGVMRWDVSQDFNRVYRDVYRSLEEHQFFVIFEANIGRNLRGYAGPWGKDYKRSDLEEVRSMVFYNSAYTNHLSSQDPNVLSLCPMQITFLQDGSTTSILFNRPTTVGQGSAAMPLLKEIEAEVGKAVEAGISAATTREPIPGRVVPPFPGTPPVP